MTNSDYNRERSHLKQNSPKSFIFNEKKLIIATAILSILVVISVFNRNTFSIQNGRIELASTAQDHSRQIASMPLGTTNSEDKMTKELSMKALDGKARWGQNPSRVEQLTFGLLEGKYSVNLKDGKLNGFELSDLTSQPKLVKDLENFISENKEILPVHFASIAQVQTTKSEIDFIQRFALMSAASRRMAEVEFHLDNLGRIISMRVNKSL